MANAEGQPGTGLKLMPYPRSANLLGGAPLIIDQDFTALCTADGGDRTPATARVIAGIYSRIERQTGLFLIARPMVQQRGPMCMYSPSGGGAGASAAKRARTDPPSVHLTIQVTESCSIMELECGDDESYELQVEQAGAVLKAKTRVGGPMGIAATCSADRVPLSTAERRGSEMTVPPPVITGRGVAGTRDIPAAHRTAAGRVQCAGVPNWRLAAV